MSICYGTQMIELAKGKYSIEVTDKSALISALEMVKQAVELGEIDAQITAASLHARRAFDSRLAQLNPVKSGEAIQRENPLCEHSGLIYYKTNRQLAYASIQLESVTYANGVVTNSSTVVAT